MNGIESLWKLQNHYNAVKQAEKDHNVIANNDMIKMLGIKLQKSEKRISDLKDRIDGLDVKLNRRNSALKDYDYKLREVEKSLYKGNILDLKQLTFLNKEREIIKEKIKEKEMEILSLFQELEELREQFSLMQADFNDLRKEYTKVVKEYKESTERLKIMLETKRKEIETISSTIDEELMKRFTELIKGKGEAVVEVINGRCGGCNMVLPAIIVDRLKNKDVILSCENCDRILYFKK